MNAKIVSILAAIAGILPAASQTVPVTGTLVPAGAFRLADSEYIRGTGKIVTNYTDLLTIPAYVRQPGLRAYVIDDGREYILGTDTNTWTASNYLLTTEMNLLPAEQAVVRQNIQAGSSEDIAGFPSITGKTNIVFSGPYALPAAGSPFGMSTSVPPHVQIAFINAGDNGRIWNDTTVRQVEFFVPVTLPTNAQVYIDFYRVDPNDNRCNLVASTPDLTSLLVPDGSVQLITLPNYIDVKMGDLTGGHVVYDGTNWGAAFNTTVTGSGNTIRYAYTVNVQDGVPWFAPGVGIVPSSVIPISVYGDAPVFCMFGDSRIDGYPYSNCLTKGSSAWGGTWTATADPANLVGQLTGLSIRNEGRSGFDTGEMEARIGDVTNSLASYYIFCTGLYNDIYASRTQAQFNGSCTNIINTLLTAGGKVIVVPDFPFKDMQYLETTDTDIQNTASDDWMGGLRNLILTYYSPDDVIWVDTRNYMGQLRPNTGGPNWRNYNRWDLLVPFRYNAIVPGAVEPGSRDLLHWSAAGEEAAARAITSGMRKYFKTHAP